MLQLDFRKTRSFHDHEKELTGRIQMMTMWAPAEQSPCRRSRICPCTAV